MYSKSHVYALQLVVAIFEQDLDDVTFQLPSVITGGYICTAKAQC
jgi:hypothetical protein